jgi:hypothetical protein
MFGRLYRVTFVPSARNWPEVGVTALGRSIDNVSVGGRAEPILSDAARRSAG